MAAFTAISYGIGYAVGFLGATVGLSLPTMLTLTNAAVNLAGGLALNAVARALAPRPHVPQQEIQAIINQMDAPRRIYVGENLAGGIRALFDVKDSVLHQVVVVSHGHVSQFVQFWIDSVPVALSADNGVVTGEKAGYVWSSTRDGTGVGGDYAQVLARFASWDETRRLQNQATFVVMAKAPGGNDFMKVFPKSYNTAYQWVVRGQRLYDPRDLSTTYSDNAALVKTHYLTHPEGFRLSRDEINWDSVAAMADVADQLVPQLAGHSEVNLRLWGYWTLDEEPSSVLARMHTSSGIRAYEMQDGRIGLIGGSFGTPACTLTAKDIREIQTSEAISEREGYNVLRVFHLSLPQKYEVIEVDAWRDEARLAQEGEIAQEHRLEMCPNRSQARRLAKRQIHDDNRQKIEIITNLVGLKARWPRYDGQRHTILLDYRPEDGSGRIITGEYEVLDHEFDPVALECRISLGRVNRASEEWTVEQEGETTADLPGRESNPPPEMVATFSQRVVQVSSTVKQAVLDVTASQVADREDLTIEAQYRRVGATSWVEMTVSDLTAESNAVEDGVQYEARVKWRGVFDGIAPWVPLDPITVQIETTA